MNKGDEAEKKRDRKMQKQDEEYICRPIRQTISKRIQTPSCAMYNVDPFGCKKDTEEMKMKKPDSQKG